MKLNKLISIIAGLAVVVGMGMFVYSLISSTPPPPPPPPLVEQSRPERPPSAQPPDDEIVLTYPVGKLIQTSQRDAYEDEQMRLYIPRLGFEGPVFDGTDDDTLKKGVGLFEYAVMPRETWDNFNTSIAGHRDIYGCEFYYIHTIEEGDLIYILYEDILFTYEVEDSFITHDEDWDPVRIKEYARVTLQSCDPIGIASERIFVVGRLIDIEEGGTFPQAISIETEDEAEEAA